MKRLLHVYYRIRTLSDTELSICRIYYSLVVLQQYSTIAMRSRLPRCLIKAMRIAVVTPASLRSKFLRHLQSLLHEYSAILLEATLCFFFDGCLAPKGMPLTFQFYGQSLVRFEGGPILSEDRPPTLEVYHAHAAK